MKEKLIEKLIEKLTKLIDLKTILSIIVVISYTVMIFMKIVEPDYKDLVLMILMFYFTKKDKKEV